MKKQDISGNKYGSLTAIERVGLDKSGHSLWKCVCDCGKESTVRLDDLKTGGTRSCGCGKAYSPAVDNLIHGAIKHGDARYQKIARLYRVWQGMKTRCNNPNSDSYRLYGKRGISVCPEWNEYENFKKWALENGYDETAPFGECTLDRIDVNGDYEPENCRWVDMKTQQNNKR